MVALVLLFSGGLEQSSKVPACSSHWGLQCEELAGTIRWLLLLSPSDLWKREEQLLPIHSLNQDDLDHSGSINSDISSKLNSSYHLGRVKRQESMHTFIPLGEICPGVMSTRWEMHYFSPRTKRSYMNVCMLMLSTRRAEILPRM